MHDDFSSIMNNLSENARIALQKADFFSKKYNKGYMGTEHLLMGLSAHDVSMASNILSRVGIEIEDLQNLINEPESDVTGGDIAMMSLSESMVLTLRMAAEDAKNNDYEIISTFSLLCALMAQERSRAYQMVKALIGDDGVEELKSIILALRKSAPERNRISRQATEHKKNTRWLSRYGRNLTELAKEGKIDIAIGRDTEIERVITVLSRRTKSNPVLIGEAGVGKTAIAEGLALRIAKNEIPTFLIGKQIYQIDLSSLVAGTKFRGDFEERIKGIIDEAVNLPNVILFIDELHLLSGAGSGEGTMDAANILKPALARGEIHLIGATTLDEYRKLEKDKALARRFQTVYIEEPSPENTLKILKGIKKYYEKHHNIEISDTLLETAINMSTRYIGDRFMPDKVIDVIDEASALARVSSDKEHSSEYRKLKIQQEKLLKQYDKDLLKGNSFDLQDAEAILNKISDRLEEISSQNPKQKNILTEDHLARAISLKTGIPVSKVHGSEAKLLSNLEAHLKKSIIGQDEAIAAIAKAIRRGRSGIADSRRPIGSFIFMGPTGVGKTELARVIATEVFGGENALIKLDMSEYAEKHNVARLFGAPAGYIGYDEGGKLTEAVRRRPYSVVLFDEIEKAHPEVFNILLQILEDGILTDGHGNKVRFNNTVIILTSNLGAEQLTEESELGFAVKTKKDKKALAAQHQESKSIAHRALKRHMRPELVNRLDAILVFHSLTRSDVEKIFDNFISQLKKRLASKKVGMAITDRAKDQIIKLGFSPKFGARPLRRVIEENIESLISESLISGDLESGQIAFIDYSRKKFIITSEDEADLLKKPQKTTKVITKNPKSTSPKERKS